MSRFRLWLGERLHILADMVLPIPAFVKGGTFVIAQSDRISTIEARRIIEGRDVYKLMQEYGLETEQAKELAFAETRKEIMEDIARNALSLVEYSVIEHGTKTRVYYEMMGRTHIIHRNRPKG